MVEVAKKSGVVFRGRLVRAPLLAFALAMTTGILAGRLLPAPLTLWLALLIGLIVAAFVTLRTPHLRKLTIAIILLAIFAFGAGWFTLAYNTISKNDVSRYASDTKILSTVRGRICSYPQMVQPLIEFGYKPDPQLKFLLEVQQIKTGNTWADTSGIVRVSINEPYSHLRSGDRVEIAGWLGRFPKPSNPGQYDSRKYARLNGSWVWMKVPTDQAVAVLESSDAPTAAAKSQNLFWRARSYLRQHLTESGDLSSGRLVGALVIGERHSSLRSLNRTMKRAGIAHLLSISGLHLGIFLGFAFLLCRLATISPKPAALIVLVMLIAYVILAEPRAPLLRSAIMAAALILGTLAGRRVSSLNALALAMIVLLVIDPRQLFLAGFQMSFAIVAGIILLYRRTRELLFGWWLRRRGLLVFRKNDRTRRWLYFGLGNWIISFITVSLIAYTIAAPLAAVHFGVFSPYAILLSMLLLPLIVAVLIPGYCAMALAGIAPNLSSTIGSWANSAADLLAWTIDKISHLPALSIPVRPVGWIWAATFYAAVLLFLFARKKLYRHLAAATTACIFIATTIATQQPASTQNQGRFDLLSVGGGQCAMLQTPTGKTYIFDAGTRSGFDLYHRVFEPYKLHEKLPAPNAIFISHANSDHYNAIPYFLRAGIVQKVYTNTHFNPSPKPEPTTKPHSKFKPQSLQDRLLDKLQKAKVPVNRLKRGDTLTLDKHTRLEILWPPETPTNLASNNTSLVIKITCCGKTILLPGDIEQNAQTELLKNPDQLKTDILIWPHHGGYEKSLPAFINAAAPKYLLVSNSRVPKGPSAGPAKVRDFYQSIKKKYRSYYTARDGWISLKLAPAKINVKTMR